MSTPLSMFWPAQDLLQDRVLHQSRYSSTGVQNHLEAHLNYFGILDKKCTEQQSDRLSLLS